MSGVGIDIVDLARIAASIERAPRRLAQRLCSPEELAWIDDGDDVERLAVCFAMKEAWIKANGSRPDGFRWTDYAYDPSAAVIAGEPSVWTRRDDTVVAIVGPASLDDVVTVPLGSSPEGLTDRELAYCLGSPQRTAGRVAAKTAVAALVGGGHAIEVLPGEHPPEELGPCRGSHPPRVFVDGEPSHVEVSITHGYAVAAAVAFVRQR